MNTKNKIERQNKNTLDYIRHKSVSYINWFKKNKDKVKFLIPIAVISSILMIFMIFKTFTSIYSLNKEAKELNKLNIFSIRSLETSEYTKEKIKTMNNISDLIKYELELSKEIKKYSEYLGTLQSPYNNLMQYIFLPNLNIRKDPFTKEIDINIIGKRFLEKNPYSDIKLLQKRSDFIKNVGDSSEFNQVDEIIIGDLTEEGEHFYIPINIKFTSNSKRSFLLLVEKLSMTSNQKNISLINEFIYNLRNNIKDTSKDKLKNLEETLSFDTNKSLGYSLYQWLFDNSNNELLTESIITQTIRDTTICGDEQDSACFYKFRDKYRGIPSLAYTIGIENNKDKVRDLKKFLQELAPIMKINTFNFERSLKQDLKNFENLQYQGEIQINIYGMGIKNEEVIEISEKLGNECISNALNSTEALKQIEEKLINIGDLGQTNTSTNSNLWELKTIIEDIDKEFNTLSNYKKIIKLFEIYRMLRDGNLCKI